MCLNAIAAARTTGPTPSLSRFLLSASGGSRAPGQGECSAEQDADHCQSGRGRARKDHGTFGRDAPRVAALIRARLSRVPLPDERINENDGHGGGRNGAYERAPASAHNAGGDETQHRGRQRQSGPRRPNARVLVLEVPEQPQGRGNDGREEGCDGPVHRAPATVVPPSGCVGCSFPCQAAVPRWALTRAEPLSLSPVRRRGNETGQSCALREFQQSTTAAAHTRAVMRLQA
jgi:hypothetical protein